MLIPYLKDWAVITKSGRLFASQLSGIPLDTIQREIVTRLIEGGCDLDDLGRLFPKAWQADPQGVRALVLKFLKQLNCSDLAELDLPDHVDAIIIDRGWGGVYQNAIDLWRFLNRHHRVLLISPVDPKYGFPEELSNFLITPQRLSTPNLSLVSILCLARTILRKVSCDLLMFTHRAMTPYFFDVVRERPTIIYGDSHADACLEIGEGCEPEAPDTEIAGILQELYFGTPFAWQNLLCSKALYWSFKHAVENWFWNEEQYQYARRQFPTLAERFHVVFPPIDTETLTPMDESATDKKWILFTTSSEAAAVPRKGLMPLLRILDRIPEARLRVVLYDKNCVPHELSAMGNRGEVLFGVGKEEMLPIYRQAAVNCRISIEDTSSVSIVESMSCGVPVIVSPLLAKHIPAIEDGVNGFVIDPDDLDRLEEKLKFLLRNPEERNKMGAEARRAILGQSLSIHVDRIVRYFQPNNNPVTPSEQSC